MKWLWGKIKTFFKWLWSQLKDWRNFITFWVIKTIFDSPTIVGYVLWYITKDKYHLVYANAYLAFWQVVPLYFPAIIGITLGLRKIYDKIIERGKGSYKGNGIKE